MAPIRKKQREREGVKESEREREERVGRKWEREGG